MTSPPVKKTPSPSVGVVMVLFHPNPSQLQKAVEALLPQVNFLVVVDNTPDIGEHDSANEAILPPSPKTHYISLGKNTGIAAAQNVGLRKLRALGAEFVVFSDQDSLADPTVVHSLLEGFFALQNAFPPSTPLVAVGALPVNKWTNRPYRLPFNHPDRPEPLPIPHIPAPYLTSSFSLTPMKFFEEIGLFNEQLFIDGVESEWFWRAKEKINGKMAVLPDTPFLHELGRYKKILWRDSSMSSTFRIYFQLRNYIWLRRLPYAPAEWKRRNLKGMLLKIVYFPIFEKPRLTYASRILKGIFHGFTQRLGAPQHF